MLLLSGDIGGTKTILRLVEVTPDRKSWQTIEEAKYASGKYPDLVPMVQEFLGQYQLSQPELASFAIAGPVINQSCILTNLNWELTSTRLAQALNISQVILINDFAANSYGVLGLKPEEIATLQPGKVIEHAPIAVIGAGTGLGESFLIAQNDSYGVFASEGGHTDFAPCTELESKLWHYLYEKLNHAHVSVERVVSGQGITNIYQFLRDTNFAPENSVISQKIKQWESQDDSDIDPGAVIAMGSEDSDPLCLQTMKMFIRAYGAETGNLALKILPYGGVYLAGGIAAKNLSLMKQGDFIEAFLAKGRMGKLLKDIPVHVILNPQVGLLGSILYALDSSV